MHALEDDRAHAYPGIIANHDAAVALAAGFFRAFFRWPGRMEIGIDNHAVGGQQNALANADCG
jgi:hypothetical protein